MDSIEKNNYFINMFQNIDKNIILDEQQIKIIKDNSKILLVIAGTGSGKTTTMTAKVKYLQEKKKVKLWCLCASVSQPAKPEKKKLLQEFLDH